MFLYDELDPQAVHGYLQTHDAAQLVDVREPYEYEEGHLPGARLMPLGSFGQHYQELDASRPVVVVCAGGVRSARACQFLTEHGFKEVINVAEGTMGWQQRGLPIED